MFNLLKPKTRKIDETHVETYVQLVRKSAKTNLTPAEQTRLDAAAEALQIGPEGPLYVVDSAPTQQPRSVAADLEAVQRHETLSAVAVTLDKAKDAEYSAYDALSAHDAETVRLSEKLKKDREMERGALGNACWDAKVRHKQANEAAEELAKLRRVAWQVLGEPDPGAPPLPVQALPEVWEAWAQKTTAYEIKNEKWRFWYPVGDYGGRTYNPSPKPREEALVEWLKKTLCEVENYVAVSS